MTVEIREFREDLSQKFLEEKARLEKVLPEDTTVEHVGSTAIGIEGKNIVDILVGVESQAEMAKVRNILAENGYVEGHDTHPDRIFMATRPGETGEGDFHVHICPQDADSYLNMILFRDYLREHPDIAQEYVAEKHKCAKQAGFDRKQYKALKSKYIEKLLKKLSQNHIIPRQNPDQGITQKVMKFPKGNYHLPNIITFLAKTIEDLICL